jgi:hypothetical protein
MAYDPNSQRVILVNGGNANVDPPIHDMWAWDGTTWTELKPATIPTWCPNSYATDRDLSVVMQIACNPTLQADLGHMWEWNGSDWTYVATSGVAPPGRFGFVFAYDPDHRQTVFAAGCTSESAPSSCLGDTWLLTHGTWSQSPARITPSVGPNGAYDEARHQIVHIALSENSRSDSDVETWTWDGKAWTLHKSSHRPPSLGPVVYDPATRQVITFGGQRDSQLLNETWGWNGEDWVQLSPRGSVATPPAAAASPTPSPSPTASPSCSINPLPGLCVGRPATPQEEAAMIAVGRPAFEADWGFKDYSACSASDMNCFKLGEPARAMVGTNAGTFYGQVTNGPGSVGGGGAGCFVFLYQDSSGWHYINGHCGQSGNSMPGPQDRVFVSGCANVRDAAGLKSNVIGCLTNGTLVDVDSAPVYLDGHIWWHLANRGWMAHDYLVAPKGTP